MDVRDLREHFKELRNEYSGLAVKLSFFEELVRSYERESDFILNMDTIIGEEKGVLRRILKLGRKIKGFKFHRATHARLMLLNRQSDMLRIKYDSWKITKGQVIDEIEDKIEFLRCQDISDKLMTNILKEAKKIRTKIVTETNWSNWPAKTKASHERDSLRKNYELLKTFVDRKTKAIEPLKEAVMRKERKTKQILISEDMADSDLDFDLKKPEKVLLRDQTKSRTRRTKSSKITGTSIRASTDVVNVKKTRKSKKTNENCESLFETGFENKASKDLKKEKQLEKALLKYSKENCKESNSIKRMIISEMKTYFLNTKTFNMSELDALLQAKNLERKIRSRVKTQRKYESVLKKILNLFKRISEVKLEHISKFLTNTKFKTRILAKLANKKVESLRVIEEKLIENKNQNSTFALTNVKAEAFDHVVGRGLHDCKIKKLKRDSMLLPTASKKTDVFSSPINIETLNTISSTFD
jgi:hypothetical protein